jgi:hypothetical protein
VKFWTDFEREQMGKNEAAPGSHQGHQFRRPDLAKWLVNQTLAASAYFLGN